MAETVALTDAEMSALQKVRDGGVPCDDLPARSETDVFGMPIPGERTYRRLERLGLLIFTEEDEIEINGAPFRFTPFIELTETGGRALASGSYCSTG